MPGRIPENILEDILNRINIAELIQGYIPLKRAGRNFKANCPFHHEKTPSFMVSPDRQIYHCFGCGESGNAFKFLMRHERLEFLEAVELLAKKAGVILPEIRKEDKTEVSLHTQLYKVNELTSLYYEGILNSPAAKSAQSYFIKRGIKQDTAKAFRLGFAPQAWDGLITHLRNKGIALSLLEKAGLILAKDGGGYYDRFRNRVVFPILDLKSRVIGFGARVLDDTLPKYLNSPETPVYTKGNNLYGLNLSKDAIRDNDCAIIVEGYLDFIVPFQEGIRNIVASLGTALTPEQARIIRRYTHNVVVLYDPDKAGELASLRSLDIFIEEEMNVRVATLPEGSDPDSFVRKNGHAALNERIAAAESLFDYKLRVLKSRYNSRDIESKAKIASEILPTIAKLKNEVLRAEYIKSLAQGLDVKEEALFAEFKKIKNPSSGGLLSAKPAHKPIDIHPTEKLLIKLMFEEEGLINRIKNHLEPSDFKDARVSRMMSIMFDLLEQGRDIKPNNLLNQLDDDNMFTLICESTFLPDITSEDREKIISECIERMKKKREDSRKVELHNRIKDAQHSGDNEKVKLLMQEFYQLIKKG